MNPYAATALLLGVAIVQDSVLSVLRVSTARFDLLYLVVLFWSLLRGGGEGLLWAFGGGLLLDFACGGPIGRFSVALLVVAHLTSLAYEHLSHRNLLVPVLLAGVMFIPYDLSLLLVEQILGRHPNWLQEMLKITLPSAALNALLALPVYGLVYWLHVRTAGERMEW